MDSPDVRTKIDFTLYGRGVTDLLYGLLQKTRVSGALGHVGKLRWRIVMLVAVLAILSCRSADPCFQVRDSNW